MDFQNVRQPDGTFRISVTMSEEEAMEVYRDMNPTLETSRSYDQLQQELFMGLRDMVRIRSL